MSILWALKNYTRRQNIPGKIRNKGASDLLHTGNDVSDLSIQLPFIKTAFRCFTSVSPLFSECFPGLNQRQ
ncbi:MAG: hypothetical protein ACI8QF_002295 [Limisphaerales bacterium]